MPVFCFLKESTLLASGPVSHPFLSVPQHLPWLSVSAVSHYNIVLLLEELISSPPSSSSLCLPAMGVHRLTHLPVIFPIATPPSCSGAPTVSITANVCHDSSSSSPWNVTAIIKETWNLLQMYLNTFVTFFFQHKQCELWLFRTDFKCLCHTKKCFFFFLFFLWWSCLKKKKKVNPCVFHVSLFFRVVSNLIFIPILNSILITTFVSALFSLSFIILSSLFSHLFFPQYLELRESKTSTHTRTQQLWHANVSPNANSLPHTHHRTIKCRSWCNSCDVSWCVSARCLIVFLYTVN